MPETTTAGAVDVGAGRTRPLVVGAVPTPFDPAGEVDLDTFTRLLERLEPWLDAVLVGGTTAEFLTMTDAERTACTERALLSFGHERTIVHVGAASLRQVRALVTSARQVGATRLAALTPFYFPFTAADVRRFFCDVRDLADGAELLGYFFAERTGVRLSPSEIAHIVSSATLDGIKISGEVWRELPTLRTALGPALPIFTGFDQDPHAVRRLGADGVVSGLSCIDPELYHDLVRARGPHAAELQTRLDDIATRAGTTTTAYKTEVAAGTGGHWGVRVPEEGTRVT